MALQYAREIRRFDMPIESRSTETLSFPSVLALADHPKQASRLCYRFVDRAFLEEFVVHREVVIDPKNDRGFFKKKTPMNYARGYPELLNLEAVARVQLALLRLKEVTLEDWFIAAASPTLEKGSPISRLLLESGIWDTDNALYSAFAP